MHIPSLKHVFTLFIGGAGVFWCVLFMMCGSSAAVSHRFISEKEQSYIHDFIENKEKVKSI